MAADADPTCRLARLDYLIKRRPELLSSVMLRQNPHNVHEWHKRVKLFDGQPERQIKVFAEAVATADPDKVHNVDSECPCMSGTSGSSSLTASLSDRSKCLPRPRHRDPARAIPPEILQFA